MSALDGSTADRPERTSLLDRPAPPERLAGFRIVVGGFVASYLVLRSRVFVELTDRADDRFDPVGVIELLDRRLADVAVIGLLVVAIASSVGVMLGWRYRLVSVAAAISMLVLTSYRSSWGQLLHFEHLMVLFLLVLAVSPAVDAWSLDARATAAATPRPSARYGFPLAIASIVVVGTYVIAGIAKLRYGGLDWANGDTLRNHIASAATRLELFGDDPAPLARLAVEQTWLLTVAAVVTLVVELGAPIALLGGTFRTTWVIAAWAMHVGILLTMLIGFPSPLFGVAFVPFFRVERAVDVVRSRWRSGRLRTPATSR